MLDEDLGIFGENRKAMNQCFGYALKKTFETIDDAYFDENKETSM